MECRMAGSLFTDWTLPTPTTDLGMQMLMGYSLILTESILTENGRTLMSIDSSIQVKQGSMEQIQEISIPMAMA